MNCRLAAELMPLHIGDDLVDARRRETLAAHLRDCDACRGMADEWAESRSLWRRHAPPEFDAAFFDGIRRAVMHEINAPTPPSGLAKLRALFLRPRALAYAAALIIIVAAAAAQAVRLARTESALPLAARGSSITAIFRAPQPLIGKTSEPPTPQNAASNHSIRSNARAKHEARRGGVASQLSSQAQSEDQSGAVVGASSVAAARAFTRAAPPEAPLSDRAAAILPYERKMLRIEWQTSDPNVRIIWLTPQTHERPSSRTTNDYR